MEPLRCVRSNKWKRSDYCMPFVYSLRFSLLGVVSTLSCWISDCQNRHHLGAIWIISCYDLPGSGRRHRFLLSSLCLSALDTKMSGVTNSKISMETIGTCVCMYIKKIIWIAQVEQSNVITYSMTIVSDWKIIGVSIFLFPRCTSNAEIRSAYLKKHI